MAITDPYDPKAYGETSVEKRVQGIAEKDSALNQMARTEAFKAMNRRGMINSSMTVGAAQDAVLKSALPIASQDASQAFQGAEAARGRSSAREAQIRDLNAMAVRQLRDLRHDARQGAETRALQKLIATMTQKSGDRNAAADFLSRMVSSYDSTYQAIMNNTALSATQRTQHLTALKKMRDRNINFTEQLWNVDLRW